MRIRCCSKILQLNLHGLDYESKLGKLYKMSPKYFLRFFVFIWNSAVVTPDGIVEAPKGCRGIRGSVVGSGCVQLVLFDVMFQ